MPIPSSVCESTPHRCPGSDGHPVSVVRGLGVASWAFLAPIGESFWQASPPSAEALGPAAPPPLNCRGDGFQLRIAQWPREAAHDAWDNEKLLFIKCRRDNKVCTTILAVFLGQLCGPWVGPKKGDLEMSVLTMEM